MALQHVEGTIYKIAYVNKDGSNRTITIVGDYAPETIWQLAECLLACVKSVWFNDDNTVKISDIQATGNTEDVAKVV